MKNWTEMVAILDKSGSMGGQEKEVITSFNKLIDEQKALGSNASMTLVVFDDKTDILYTSRTLDSVSHISSVEYSPSGMTALYDAIGRAINRVGSHLASLAESDRPDKVIVTIITDGQENASKEFNGETVKQMIRHQEEKYSWKFVFLSNDLGAVQQAKIQLNLSNTVHTRSYSASVVTANAFYSSNRS